MTAILAIDPGTTRSAWVLLEAGRILDFDIRDNDEMSETLRGPVHSSDPVFGWGMPTVVIEDIEPRQQPLGRDVADTLRWIGRFMEAARPLPVHLVTRRAVTAHHVDGGTRDADKRIRAAIIDRYGVGSERKGGPLEGIVKDLWSALAIGLYWADLHGESAAYGRDEG